MLRKRCTMLRAITVCVDMADLLAVTLPYNKHHFDEVCVVTHLRDSVDAAVALDCGARVFRTDSFYDDGASFNKWKALEEGLDAFGRRGWMCVMDCDVLWPKGVEAEEVDGALTVAYGAALTVVRPSQLCTPMRRMYYDLPKLYIEGVPPLESEWPKCGLHPQQKEFAGYTQLFRADDPHLGAPPWHETDWRHAGGADSFFQRKWPDSEKVRPPFEVLHLGPSGVNWCGRTAPYLDGSMPEKASERYAELRRLLGMRRRGDNFAAERISRPR